MEVVSYYEGWEIIIKKQNEIVRLENGIVISEIVIGMMHGQLYKGFPKKSPIYQFRLLVTAIKKNHVGGQMKHSK
jgi:hypothetical protein